MPAMPSPSSAHRTRLVSKLVLPLPAPADDHEVVREVIERTLACAEIDWRLHSTPSLLLGTRLLSGPSLPLGARLLSAPVLADAAELRG